MADDTRRYVDAFVAALRQCGHSQADLRRAILGHVMGDAAPALPTPAVRSDVLALFTTAQMERYAKDYAASLGVRASDAALPGTHQEGASVPLLGGER